jgi:aminotransferase
MDRAAMSRVRRGLTTKIAEPKVTIRTRMGEIAQTMDDVIAMGPGDPDLPTPPHIIAAAKQALDAGATHYTPPPGDPRLRAGIAGRIAETQGGEYDPASEIIVTTGAEEAIYMALVSLVDAGDEVLVPQYRFTTYDWGTQLSLGTIVEYPTVFAGDVYRLDAGEIEKRLTERSKIIVIVSPDNPTGGVARREEVTAVADLAKARDLIVISDEIYHPFVYDGGEHYSILREPHMRDRTLLIDGFSKAYAMTGWRVGYLAGPADFMRAIIEVKHALSVCAPAVSQAAALAALQGPQECVAEMRAIYDERRQGLVAALADMGLGFVHPAGAFYVWTNVSSTGMNAEEFVYRLLLDTGVLISPGTIFGQGGEEYMRMSVLVPGERIAQAVERMETVVRNYRVGDRRRSEAP